MNVSSNHFLQRFMSLLLVIAMLFNTLPTPFAQAWAKEQFLSVHTASGESIVEDESWEELYPNGTFAFAEAQLSLREGDAAQSLTIYRLGGGLGEALVTVQLTPPADQNNRYYAVSSADYRILDPADGIRYNSDLYGNVEIDLVFSEDEFDKRILIEPVDDAEHESTEFLLATIVDVQGAAFTETANRATVIINDNEEIIPSIASFKETNITADRSAENAVLTVQRSEGLQYLFSVDYITGSLTAEAGSDYASSEGTLIFEPGETEKTILIPLVQDYTYRAVAERSFIVGLTDPRTGSIEETAQVAGVHLVNSYGETAGPNADRQPQGDATGSVYEDVYGNVEGSVYSEVYEEVYEELQEVDAPGAPVFGTPNLITLLAMDNDKRIDLHTENTPLIANPDLDMSEPQIVSEAPAQPERLAAMMPLSARMLEPTISFVEGAGALWKPWLVVANQSNLFPSDSQFTLYYDVLSEFDEHFDPAQGRLKMTRNGDKEHPWFEMTADGVRDPLGFMMSKQPIDSHLYENFSSISFKARLNLSDATNEGYVGLGSPASHEDVTAIQKKRFFTLASNFEGDTGVKGEKYVGELDWQLKDTFTTRSKTGYNQSANKYLLMGAYDYDGSNNADFEVDLIDFGLRRASPYNLSLEYNSIDGYAGTLTSFRPTLTVDSGGIDPATGHPYIGSKVLISANSRAGCYRIARAQLMVSESQDGPYTAINTVYSTQDGNTCLLPIASNKGDESARLDDLSCKTYDTHYYKIVVTYESVKTLSVTIADALANSMEAAHTIKNAAQLKENSSIIINKPGAAINDSLAANVTTLSGTVKDLETIQFGLDPDYVIIYNGEFHAGNADIGIILNAEATATFQISHKDLLSKTQDVRVLSIDNVSIYLDESGNGLPEADELYARLIPGSYDETLFAPEKVGNRVYNKIMEIEYTRQPYAYVYDPVLSDIPENTEFTQKVFFDHIGRTAQYRTDLTTYAPDLLRQRPITLLKDSEKFKAIGVDSVRGVAYIPLGGDTSGSEEAGNYSAWNPAWSGQLQDDSKFPFTLQKSFAHLHHEALGWKKVADGEIQTKAFLGSFLPYDTQIITIFSHTGSLVSSYPTKISATRKFIPQNFINSALPQAAVQEKIPEESSNSLMRSAQPEIALPDLNIDLELINLSLAGDELLMSIGIPLFSASPSTPSSTSPENNGGGYFANQMQSYTSVRERLKEFMRMVKAGKRVEVAPKADYDVSFDVGLSINILMTYDDTLGKWQFDQALFMVHVGGTVSLSQKMPPPVSFIYVYVVFGADFTISTGLGMTEVVNSKGITERTVFFKGIMLDAGLFAEVGAGIGLDGLLSLEVYFKMNIGMSATLAEYNPSSEEFESRIDAFSLRGALGFRVELIIFTYEMDIIGFKVDYDRNRPAGREWQFSKVLFEQSSTFIPLAARSAFAPADATDPIEILQSTSDPRDSQQLGAKLYRTPQRTNQQLGYQGEISGQTESQSDIPLVQAFGFGQGETSTDFSLGRYNVTSAAYKLGDNLAESAKLRLVETSKGIYVFYHLDIAEAGANHRKALVFSKLNTSQTPYDLVHPLGVGDDVYAFVSSAAGLDDGDFDIVSNGDTVYIAWVQQKPGLVIPAEARPADELAAVSENNVLRFTSFDTNLQKLAEPIDVSNESSKANEYLPRIACDATGEIVVAYMQTFPYSSTQRQAIIAERADSLGYEMADIARQREIDSELMLQELMLGIYGAKSDLVQARFDAASHTFSSHTHQIALLADGVTTAAYSTVTAHSLWPLDNNEFGYAYILEYPHHDPVSGKHATLKNLYIGFWDSAANTHTTKLLSSLIDYTSESDSALDGIVGASSKTTPYVDPFYGDIGFGKAKLTSAMENYFYFNRNGVHYYLDSAQLTAAKTGQAQAKPFFELPEGQIHDGMAGVRLTTRTNGSLAAIAVRSVAYTGNNALFVYEYDSIKRLWSNGKPLAMRGLDIYERVRSNVYDEARAAAAYYADDYQLTFANPQVLVTANDDLLIMTEASLIELQEEIIQIDGQEPFTQKIPKLEQANDGYYTMAQADKQLYALHYKSMTDQVADLTLKIDKKHLVPGDDFTAYISFTNIGSNALSNLNVGLGIIKADGSSGGVAPHYYALPGTVPAGATYSVYLPASDVFLRAFDDWDDLAGGTLYFGLYKASDFLAQSSDFPSGTYTYPQGPDLRIVSSRYSVGKIVKYDNEYLVGLNLELTVTNAGYKAASPAALVAEKLTKVNNPKIPSGYGFKNENAPIFGNRHDITFDSFAPDRVVHFTYISDDYLPVSVDGDTYQQPNVSNNLYLPASYFTDGTCLLRLSLETPSPESYDINLDNNYIILELGPIAELTVDDSIEMTTKDPYVLGYHSNVFGYTTEKPKVLAEERPLPGQERLLSEIIPVGVDGRDSRPGFQLSAVKAGETVLRLQYQGLPIFADVIVRVSGTDKATTIDTTPPSIVITSPTSFNEQTKRSKAFDVSYYVTDDKGLASVIDPQMATQLALDTTSPTYTFTISENGQYEIVAVDAAGNRSARTITITNFDEFDQETREVKHLGIFDIVYNVSSSVYASRPIPLSFTVDAPDGLRNVRVVAYDEQDLDTPITVFSKDYSDADLETRFYFNCSIEQRGTYHIVADGANNKTAEERFTIRSLDTDAPNILFDLSDGLLSYTVRDDIYLDTATLRLQSQQPLASLVEQATSRAAYEISGEIALGQYGSYRIEALDIAGNRSAASVAYVDPSSIPQPLIKNPAPSFALKQDQELTFTAADIAVSSHEGDSLVITGVSTVPNTNLVETLFDAATGIVTLKGLREGDTSITVVVENSYAQTIRIPIPLQITARDTEIPPVHPNPPITPHPPVNPNPSTGSTTQPTQPSNRRSFKVAGLDVSLTEENGGRKAVIGMSGQQLKALIESEENPLVFDIREVSEAVEVAFSRSNLKALAEGGKSIRITTVEGSLTLDPQALLSICEQSGTQVSFLIEAISADNLPEDLDDAQRDKILALLDAGIPVFEISIFSGTLFIHEFDGQLHVQLPYQGPFSERLVVWHIDEGGELSDHDCSFDREAATVRFRPPHLSYYAIGEKEAPPQQPEPPQPSEEKPVEDPPIVLTIGSTIVRRGDAQLASSPVAPQILGDRTMLPFRYLIQTLLGGEVDWDEATRSVTATIDGHTFWMTIGTEEIIIDGRVQNFGQAPVIVNDYTLVPLRAFEAAVRSIDWDEATQTVSVYP